MTAANQVVQLPGTMDVATLLRWAQQLVPTGTKITSKTVRAAVARLPELCGNRFTKVGEAWEIIYQGEVIPGIKDVKGMAYLSFLLAHEGRWFDVFELCKHVEPAAADDVVGNVDRLGMCQDSDTPGIDTEEVLGDMVSEQQDAEGIFLKHRSDSIHTYLDATARKQLLKAKQEFEEDLAYMKAHPETSSEEEQDELVKKIGKIQQALGFQRSSRTFSDSKDKARKRVSKLMIEAIRERIKPRHTGLGLHLEGFVNMGFDFAYTPDEPKHWETSNHGATPKVAKTPSKKRPDF